MLINGRWSKDFHPVQATDEKGGFVRQSSAFRNRIPPDGEHGFKAEAGLMPGITPPQEDTADTNREILDTEN